MADLHSLAQQGQVDKLRSAMEKGADVNARGPRSPPGMAQVSWSPPSLPDLAEFIARDSTRYASLFVQSIIAHVEKLSEFPRSGRVVPEYGREELREFTFENYRIVYRVLGELIEVAAVVHGARLLPETLP